METWRKKYERVFEPFIHSTTIVESISKPYKYPNVSELAHKICEWFIDRRENNQGLSNIGLCVFLGISRPTLDNMREISAEHKQLIDATKNSIEEFWVECLGTSESAARFILSTMPDYTTIERQIIESDTFTINIKNPT